jgi:hypothetical protein
VTTVGRVLTSFDDYPLHQASVPIAHTATGDLNHYDRYFFNGYTAARDGDSPIYFAVAMGLYPNRHVADAAFSIVRDGQQTSVYSSQRAPADRRDATTVGPIEVRVLEPLRRLQVLVDAPQHGVRADITFDRRSPVIEEPHFFQRIGARTFFDYTRLTQFGSWTGWIELDGERIDLDPAEVLGCRDRSWGVRPVGEPSPTGAPVGGLPQFYWLWAPVNFPSVSTHFDANEYSDGRRWHEVGAVAPVGDAEPRLTRTVEYRHEWRRGTRWAQWFEYDLVDWDGSVSTVRLEPMYEFMMRGLGYGHPDHRHGSWQGESVVAGDRLSLPVADPCAIDHVHVQALCHEHGTGILEQLVIGEHVSGLTGLLEPYTP